MPFRIGIFAIGEAFAGSKHGLPLHLFAPSKAQNCEIARPPTDQSGAFHFLLNRPMLAKAIDNGPEGSAGSTV
jgi:hypothetical protein